MRSTSPPPPAAAGLIDQIRTGDQTTTVAIALNPRAGTPRVSTTTSTESTRVSIEVPLAAQSQDTNAAPVPPRRHRLRRFRSRPSRCRLFSASRTAKLQTMVIDAGHGGDDAGVHGAEGHARKTDHARRRAAAENARRNAPRRPRGDDARRRPQRVSLDERDAIANNSKADLFLSVHVNGAPSASASKVRRCTTCVSIATAKTRVAAPRQPSSCCPRVGGGTRPIDVIRWDLAQASHVGAFVALRVDARRGTRKARARWDRGRCSRRRCACSAERTCRRRSSRLPISPTPTRNGACSPPTSRPTSRRRCTTPSSRFRTYLEAPPTP